MSSGTIYNVYAFSMSNGTIKVGISKSVSLRKRQIQNSTGLQIVDAYHVEFPTRDIAFSVERNIHNEFEAFRVRGEYFKISFDEVCAAINEQAKRVLFSPESIEVKAGECERQRCAHELLFDFFFGGKAQKLPADPPVVTPVVESAPPPVPYQAPESELSIRERIDILSKCLDYTDSKNLRNKLITDIAYLVTRKNY